VCVSMDQVALAPPANNYPETEAALKSRLAISLVDVSTKLNFWDFCDGPWYVVARYYSAFGIPAIATDITFEFDREDGANANVMDFRMRYLLKHGREQKEMSVKARMVNERQMTVHVPIPLYPMSVGCTIWGLWQQSRSDGGKPKYYAAVIGTDSKDMVYLLRKGSPDIPDPTFYDEMCEVARRSGYKQELLRQCKHTQQH